MALVSGVVDEGSGGSVGGGDGDVCGVMTDGVCGVVSSDGGISGAVGSKRVSVVVGDMYYGVNGGVVSDDGGGGFSGR